jgi:hypothetical protein
LARQTQYAPFMRDHAIASAILCVVISWGCAPEGSLGHTGPGADGGPSAGCEAGVDTDFDLLDNATECMLGLDPSNPDVDGDGVRDGVEASYPKACIASDPAMQRRDPVPGCATDSDCLPSEACLGLDPRMADSDRDGVPDALEDTNADGTIDPSRGETDPRLADTDGDGVPDSEEASAICRPDGLAMPEITPMPAGTTTQIGLHEAWNVPREIAGSANGLLLDEPTAEVAALVVERAASGDAVTEAAAVEAAIASATSATPVLVGRTFTTHDMRNGVASFYRIADGGTAGTLRDAVAQALTGTSPAAAADAYRAAGSFYLEVVTLVDSTEPVTVVIAAIAPEDAFGDDARPTAIRVRDLTNATGLSQAGRTLDFGCDGFVADRLAQADFVWLVDVSGSMGDDQERLGNVAGRFFERLTDSGVDFRVGVFEASTTDVDFESPGFQFIDGTDPMGVQKLQFEVTDEQYMGDGMDDRVPYDLGDSSEEPIGAGVVVLDEFERYRMMGSTDPNRTLRPDSQIVTFFVTDEPGSNDDGRYFSNDTARWGGTPNDRIMGAVDYYATRNVLTFGLVQDFGGVCPEQEDFPKCTILGGGSGAFIPITTATDTEVTAAMDRIVEAVAGASSRFVLTKTPISATIQVVVAGVAVPRSRAEGFDYDGAANSIVFHGRTYRPAIGTEVTVSYRVWGRRVE